MLVRPFLMFFAVDLALASFKTTLRLVDYIDAALTAHDAAIAMTLLERAEGVTYFHVRYLIVAARGDAEVACAPEGAVNSMVDDTGIEPVTPSMSTKCSTAELIARKHDDAGHPRAGHGSIKGSFRPCKGF